MYLEAQKALKGKSLHVFFSYSSLGIHFWLLLKTQYWAAQTFHLTQYSHTCVFCKSTKLTIKTPTQIHPVL